MTARSSVPAAALRAALDRYRAALADVPVRTLLLEHSHLPGPRGNLELAALFAEEVAERAAQEPAPWWDLCAALAALSARRAPSNDPGEFVAFCGTVGAAAVACVAEERTGAALELAVAAASDPRWRLLEAAPTSLQRLLMARRAPTLAALERLARHGRPLELRAVIAAVAEPAVIAVPELADAAVALHRDVLARFLASRTRSSRAMRTLRQGLGYSLSVVTTARPEEGFTLVRELIDRPDADAHWIARENLRKARLRKRYPDRVTELLERLESAPG
ncbi:MAG: hypothetical protein P8Y02_08180 [Deinococcales bacterium]